MEAIIDRIEGEYIIVEIDLDHFIEIPLKYFEDAREGDKITLTLSPKEDNKKIEKLMNDLFED